MRQRQGSKGLLMDDRRHKSNEDTTGSSLLLRISIPVIVIFFIVAVFINTGHKRSEIRQEFFFDQLEDDNIAEVAYIDEVTIVGTFKKRPPAPAVFNKNGKFRIDKKGNQIDKKGNPILLERSFEVFLDPKMSEETRARLEQLYAVQGVQRINSARRDNSELFYYLSMFLPIFAILLISTWIWALFDCLRNEPSEGNDKIYVAHQK
jgi:hypothetical protein